MPIRLPTLAFFLALGASTAVRAQTPAPASPADPCAGAARCAAMGSFTVTLTDFRESLVTYYRVVGVTLRFRNTLNRPLVLGYVAGSGLITDDQGNRYTVSSGSLRGIGEIQGNTFDPKFTLRPGESADARMELSFRPGNAILGTQYVFELAAREIDPLPGNQWRLGREHAIQFRDLGQAPVVAAAPPAEAPVNADPAPEPIADPCGDKPRCYATGPFVAEVTHFTDSKASYYHFLTYTVRFRNLSSQPLVLAYAANSAVALDDQGNRYGPAPSHVKGMGISQGNRADPSFRLRPGEAREATFQMVFRPGRAVLGTTYTFDLAVEELEILPRDQIRTQREFTVGFRDLTLGSAPSVEKAAKGVLDIFRKRKP